MWNVYLMRWGITVQVDCFVSWVFLIAVNHFWWLLTNFFYLLLFWWFISISGSVHNYLDVLLSAYLPHMLLLFWPWNVLLYISRSIARESSKMGHRLMNEGLKWLFFVSTALCFQDDSNTIVSFHEPLLASWVLLINVTKVGAV